MMLTHLPALKPSHRLQLCLESQLSDAKLTPYEDQMFTTLVQILK